MIYVVFALLLSIMSWTSCNCMMDFSEVCSKCVLDSCAVKVGLLAEFSTVEAAAVDEATSVIKASTELQTKWPMQL